MPKIRPSMMTSSRWAHPARRIGLAFLMSTVLGAGALQAAGPDRLLPTAAQQKLSVSSEQDGRAVDIVIDNSSDLVFTGGQISCFAMSPPRRPLCPAARNSLIPFTADELVAPIKSNGLGRGSNKEMSRVTPTSDPSNTCDEYIDLVPPVLIKTLEKKLLPRQSGQLYVEVSVGVTVGACYLVDPRGRERRWSDRL